jgi:exodeoxyribonuclease VIII
MKRDYLSASALKAFAKSPNHYLEYVTAERTTTPALLLGSLVHCMILEPSEVEKRYVVEPEVDRRTKVGKEQYTAFLSTCEGKETVKQDVFDTALKMQIAVTQTAAPIFQTPGKAEVETRGEIGGFPFLAYLDYETERSVFDVKTTQDASPAAFQREAYNYGYHLQGAVYTLLTGKPFYWVAVEKTAPYNVAVYQQSKEAYKRSAEQVLHLVQMFVQWDGTPQGYQVPLGYILDLPKWA